MTDPAEAAAEAIIGLYSRHADDWARMRDGPPTADERPHLERYAAALPEGAEVLDLGRRFDGVVAWFSVFHLTAEAQDAMAAVYARHLRPGGVLMFIGGPSRGVAMGTWMEQPLYHASLEPSEYRAGLEQAGLIDIEEAPLKSGTDDPARVWTARRSVSD